MPTRTSRRERMEGAAPDEPCFVISIAARLVELHPQTLRYYERLGLVTPSRSRGKVRLYSLGDIERLRRIARLTDELGVNLAGVDVILNLTERMEQMQREMEEERTRLLNEIERLRAMLDERQRNLPTIRRRQLGSGREGPGKNGPPKEEYS